MRGGMPLIIGIAGGTGSGKTTLARALAHALPPAEVSLLEHDSYYRNRIDLPLEQRQTLNFDHPDALETELLLEHLRQLQTGQPVCVPRYDYGTHRRLAETVEVKPTRVILLEGILIFSDERVREHLDIKIFVDTDADIRAFRRIQRDMEGRGRSFASIHKQYFETVRPMHERFVEPSKRYADVIIPEGGENTVGVDLILSKLRGVIATAENIRDTFSPASFR